MDNGTRYWVVGGEFTDTSFTEMVAGTAQLSGPFPSYEVARARWRIQAEATRADVHTRYTITREGG